jgi:hypothetical protein
MQFPPMNLEPATLRISSLTSCVCMNSPSSPLFRLTSIATNVPHAITRGRERLTSRHLQHGFRKAASFGLQPGRRFVDLLEVVFGQIDIHRTQVFLEPM